MNQLTEYSEKTLYDAYKPEEICFVIESSYSDIGESSNYTDNLEKAKELSKEYNYPIFIFTKRYGKECLDTELLFEDLINNVNYGGLQFDYLETEKQEFIEITEKWFNKVISDYWFPDEPVGVLKDE